MREIRMLRTTWQKLETQTRDGLRHRNIATASGQLLLPRPVTTAPAFDPTDEWRLEAGLRRGARHQHRESRRHQLHPIAYCYRASCRLYTNLVITPLQHGGARTQTVPWHGRVAARSVRSKGEPYLRCPVSCIATCLVSARGPSLANFIVPCK